MKVGRLAPVAAAGIVGLAGLLPAGSAQAEPPLRAYAGAVAGTADGPNCGTWGPSIAAPYFGGISVPLGGIGGCGLQGGIEDHSSSTGPLHALQTATAPMAGNLGQATVQAETRSDWWTIGAAARGTATGPTSAATTHEAVSFASFRDTLTLSKPGIAAGTDGTVDFRFLLDGLMRNEALAPFTEQSDLSLTMRVNDGFLWDVFRGTVVSDNEPFVRGGADGLPGDLAEGPGSLSGSTSLTSNAHWQVQWGVPFTVAVALQASVHPCCNGASSTVDHLNTASLTGLRATAGGTNITGFDVLAQSGAQIDPDLGLVLASSVPEPGALVMLVAGGMALLPLTPAYRGRRRRLSSLRG